MKTRVHIYVKGKVQGVFFRARVAERAFRLGATGWICNLPDGRVEAVFEGEDDAVEALVDFCRTGPRSAVVTGVDLSREEHTGEFKSFKVRHG